MLQAAIFVCSSLNKLELRMVSPGVRALMVTFLAWSAAVAAASGIEDENTRQPLLCLGLSLAPLDPSRLSPSTLLDAATAAESSGLKSSALCSAALLGALTLRRVPTFD